MFLLAGLGCSNRGRMTDLAFDSQLFQEGHKPLHRSRGFDPHTHRAWQLGIKLPHVVAFVLQSHGHHLPCCGVEHRQGLLASVQVTSYNSHPGLLRSEHWVNTETVYSDRGVAGVVMTSIFGERVVLGDGLIPQPSDSSFLRSNLNSLSLLLFSFLARSVCFSF